MFWELFTIVLLGFIPAILVPIRGRMVDFALNGDNKFLFYICLIIFFMLLQIALTNIREKTNNVQKISVGHKLDKERLLHCIKLPFNFTETERFFKLNSVATEASELLHESYCSFIEIFKCIIQLMAIMITLSFVSFYAVIGIIALICIGLLFNGLQMKNIADI